MTQVTARRGFALLFLLACAGSAAGGYFAPIGGITQVSAGSFHTCAISTSGAARCWGDNAYGQLGDGSLTARNTAVAVSGLASGVAAIVAGGTHACALTTGGAVKCWGDNTHGQVGDGSTTSRSAPTGVTGLESGVLAITAGGAHTCALTAASGVKCWGRNDNGQVGDNSTTTRTTPTDVAGLANGVATIDAGQAHTCARTNLGAARCWGANAKGQVGDGTLVDRPGPTDVAFLGAGVTAISAGGEHSCAVAASGGVMCWGSNALGQIGDGTNIDRPVHVGIAGVGIAASITAGQNHTCALSTSGSLTCWGANSEGQVGDDALLHRLAPQAVGLANVALVSAGANHTCAATGAGGAKCWGNDTFGQLGVNAVIRRTTFADVTAANGLVSMAAGFSHTCAITNTNGSVCWGSAATGQTGLGTAATNHVTGVGYAGGFSSGVATIAAGLLHTCATSQLGAMRCWGHNGDGQLGDGTLNGSSLPVDVQGMPSGVGSIATGEGHTCAVYGPGAKCWGRNDYGQLGDLTNVSRSTPTPVNGLAADVLAIVAGYNHTCALVIGGVVKCWGRNDYGQLGNNSTAHQSSPVDVIGLGGTATAISAGEGHTCALTANGAKCWGRNDQGQLGDGTTTTRLAPVDVSGIAGVVMAVAAGLSHTCVRMNVGGTVKCWGRNDCGQLGDGTTTTRLAPVEVTGLSLVSYITAGAGHTCAVGSGGAGKCWGATGNGQVGDGMAMRRLAPMDVIAFVNGPNPFTFTAHLNVPTSSVRASEARIVTGLSGVTPVSVHGGEYSLGCSGSFTSLPGTIGNGQAICVRHTSALVLGASVVTILTIGDVSVSFTSTTIGPGVVRANDMNGDGRSDVLWRDQATGLNFQWQLNAYAVSGQGYLPLVPANWSVGALGDASGDGRADILWREPASGLNYLWIMNGLAISSQGYMPAVSAPWEVVGMGDADGDGRADVFWRNPVTGANYLWMLNGLAIAGQGYLPAVPGSDWEVEAIADFNADGRADVFWRNTSTGQNYLWLMNGLAVANQGYLPSVLPVDWEAAGSPDADGDGRSDIVWRNRVTGDNYLWLMDAFTVAGEGYLPAVTDTNWQIVGFGDYDGNGRGDVLWRNAAAGLNYLWSLNGLAVTPGYLPAVNGTNWVPVAR